MVYHLCPTVPGFFFCRIVSIGFDSLPECHTNCRGSMNILFAHLNRTNETNLDDFVYALSCFSVTLYSGMAFSSFRFGYDNVIAGAFKHVSVVRIVFVAPFACHIHFECNSVFRYSAIYSPLMVLGCKVVVLAVICVIISINMIFDAQLSFN